MTFTRPSRLASALVALLAAMLLADPAAAQRAATGPPDWPCVQRLVPELAWGAIWTGPSPDEIQANWWDDPEIGRVVRSATAPGTPPAAALEEVQSFVSGVEGDERLTLLFKGLFEQISRERTRTIDAILRYSRGQVGRLERVGAIVDELEEALASDADMATVERIEHELHWERRVFNDRQASLRALCEQPYLLEEQLSRMVQTIRGAM